MSYGAQVKFGIARQVTGGTAVTVATSYHGFAFVSHDIGLEKDEAISANLTGRFSQGAVYDGINRVLGTVEFEMTPRNMHAAFAAAVNYQPASVTSAALRTLTFLCNTVDYDSTYVKPPFSVYSQFTDAASAEQFFDVQFGQLEMQITNGQFLRGRLTANGGARTPTGTGSASVVADAADVGVLYPWNVCSITFGGTAVGALSDLTVTLNENVDALYTNNASLNPFKYTRTGFREVTVAGTLYLVDRSLFNDFVAGTQRRLLVTLMNTRTAIQSGYFNQVVIDVPQLKLTQFKLPVSGVGEVSVPFQGRGVLDPTSNYELQITTITTWIAGF